MVHWGKKLNRFWFWGRKVKGQGHRQRFRRMDEGITTKVRRRRPLQLVFLLWFSAQCHGWRLYVEVIRHSLRLLINVYHHHHHHHHHHYHHHHHQFL